MTAFSKILRFVEQVVVAYLRHVPGISLQELRTTVNHRRAFSVTAGFRTKSRTKRHCHEGPHYSIGF